MRFRELLHRTLYLDVWYENIFLIADKADSMATKNFTVQVGGGVDSVGGE